MPDCTDLDEESHAVLAAQISRGIRSKTLVAKATFEHVELATGFDRRKVLELLSDLEVLGFLRVEGDRPWVIILESCSCEPELWTGAEPLGSAPERRRTRPSGSAADGGGGSRSEGTAPKVPVRTRARRARPRRTVAEKKPAEMTAHDLATLLARRISESRHAVPDPVNHAALRGRLAKWMREDGISPAVIHEMIDLFVKDPRRWTRDGAPAAWKCFLADRQDLLNKATNLAKAKSADNGGWEEVREKQRVKSSPEDESFEAVRERLRARRSRG